LISVIIPTLNAAHTLEDQLDALAHQRFDGEFEVIIADNGSTDDTRAVVEKWHGRLPSLRVVDASARPGSPSARNAGVHAASGTSLAFCDADDVVADGWLAAMAEGLESAPVVAGWCELVEEQTDRLLLPAGPRQTSMGFLRFADSCSMAVDKAALESVGGFAEDMLRCSDVDVSWRLQLAGYEMVEAPDALVHKRARRARRARVVQVYEWGRFEPMLYKRYRDAGMPRQTFGATLRDLLLIVVTTPLIWHPRARARWWATAPLHAGRIAGCYRARCWYP
jgi:glycosyltransferase involved in cell wall biosynthesis